MGSLILKAVFPQCLPEVCLIYVPQTPNSCQLIYFFLQQLTVKKQVPVPWQFLLFRGILFLVCRNHQLVLSDICLSCLSCKHCLHLHSNFWFCLCSNLYVFVVTTSVIFALNIGYSHAINIYSLQVITFPPVP